MEISIKKINSKMESINKIIDFTGFKVSKMKEVAKKFKPINDFVNEYSNIEKKLAEKYQRTDVIRELNLFEIECKSKEVNVDDVKKKYNYEKNINNINLFEDELKSLQEDIEEIDFDPIILTDKEIEDLKLNSYDLINLEGFIEIE